MKKIIYYILFLSCVFSSCSLDEQTYTEVDKKTYMRNASEAQNVLLGVYRDMIQGGIYGYHLSLLFTIPTDLAKCEGNSTNGFRLVPANAYTATQSEVQSTWSALYNAVYDANDFMETLQSNVNQFGDDDQQKAVVYMAEARALRALYYFELVRWYGNIALMTNTAQSSQHPSTFVQAAPEDVYKFIEADLKFAISNLPYAQDDKIRSNNSFRFSKGAALGLLTKVYATWAGSPINDKSKWEEAAKTAKILVESGKHHLLDDYEQLWRNTCNGIWNPDESLIEVSFYAPTVTGTSSQDPCGRIGKWNGVSASGIRGVRNAGNWRVVSTFLRDWKDRQSDKRWAISFSDYRYGKKEATGEDGVKIAINAETFETAISDAGTAKAKKAYDNGCCPAKWDTEKYVNASNYLVNADYSNINWYVLRYADVLLLYAEALNEWKGGPTTEAYEAINMVRRRGFGLSVNTASSLSDLATGMDHDTFQQAIRDERAYELAYEGHRRQDLIRWGIYYESIRKTAQNLIDWCGDPNYICVDFTKKGKHELLPIPQRDMKLMTSFEQNPGWK
ncbi:RagB/SusD family nutrient uptake outer membrane protein [Bacteroides sp. GM023]|uniref:RagB/SusD family nutrient uptake outer membrane protein n=1 Tax=Bacteroides sp. GM023 TaxID=2723058 RepID=UPI00168BDA2A|nr:RagB/SusD family nutrient uptake outer membrane protein [Bacteroides sp. GM023]MBD3591807.1 RagB/SusD family nutrient uptake outer membrane protein [Bacteroides sp. GM023]